jgi:hypothetical protein
LTIIFSHQSEYYLFSDSFLLGKLRHSEKQSSNYWNQINKIFTFPDYYKHYSLKDTGIIALLEKTCNPLLVRDQARNSNIPIIGFYTPTNSKKPLPKKQI